MPIDWSPFVDVVRAHQRFLLTTHVRPDGDGLGSMLALADTLRAHGKQVQLVISSPMPPRYSFLDPQGTIQRYAAPCDTYRKAEVAMVLDTGTWNQLDEFGPCFRSLSAQKLVIDHHRTQDDLGGLRLVDVSAEATGRLVFEAIESLGGPLSPMAATQLFIALAMDTGWFRFQNTSAATYALAERLVQAGAKPDLLYVRLYEDNTLARLKLMSVVLGRLQLHYDGQVAFTELYQSDYLTTGALPPDSEDLINFTRSIKGVEVGLFFMEQPKGGIKVSFRSRERVDVAKLAERFQGGGHARASGATLESTMDIARERVLAAVGEALGSPS